MFASALTEFGRRLGLPELRLSDRGLAALDVAGLGRLYLEKGGEIRGTGELLLYLTRPLPRYEAHRRRAALELCHHRHGHPLPLAVGLHHEELVLLTRLPAPALTGVSLENAARFLAAMADEIFA